MPFSAFFKGEAHDHGEVRVLITWDEERGLCVESDADEDMILAMLVRGQHAVLNGDVEDL